MVQCKGKGHNARMLAAQGEASEDLTLELVAMPLRLAMVGSGSPQ